MSSTTRKKPALKKLSCEMCGSTDVIKEDGVFVCQACGTKYSVEEAKKMMISGKVDVSGSTIKIDKSKELDNLYKLARRARESDDEDNARKYYERILEQDPESWEAALYSTLYTARSCKIGEIYSAATTLAKSVKPTVKLLEEQSESKEELKKNLKEMAKVYTEAANMFNNVSHNHYMETYNGYKPLLQTSTDTSDITYRIAEAEQTLNYCVSASGDILDNFTAAVFQGSGKQDKAIRNIALNAMKAVLTNLLQSELLFSVVRRQNYTFTDSQGVTREYDTSARVVNYCEKILKYDPNFEVPYTSKIVPTKSSSGCYVATAVYGSYDCPEVWTLRRYRDYSLASTWYGRAFIHAYYAISPTIVHLFGQTTWFRNFWRKRLDKMVARLQGDGYENTPYRDREW